MSRMADNDRFVHCEPEFRGEPGRAQHPKWIIAERHCRCGRRADHPGGEIGQPAERVGEHVTGQRHGHRVDREVAPLEVVEQRRRRSDTTGLRVTPSYASARNVVISSRRPFFCTPIVPNSRPVSQIASAQPCTTARVCSGRASVQKSRSSPSAAEQRVPHRAADQVQLMAGGAEPAPQLVGDGRHAEQLGDRILLGGIQHRHGMTSVSVVRDPAPGRWAGWAGPAPRRPAGRMDPMPVSEALRRLSEDPAFWTGGPAHRPGRPASCGSPSRSPAAMRSCSTSTWPPASARSACAVRPPASRSSSAGRAADGPYPAALRWWELDLCARVIAWEDPTLPHPGLVVALLSPFAPATADDDETDDRGDARGRVPLAAPGRAAGRAVRPEQAPLPLFASERLVAGSASAGHRRCSTRPRSPALSRPARAYLEVRCGRALPARRPGRSRTPVSRAPASPCRDEHWYAGTRPLARQILDTGDLAPVARAARCADRGRLRPSDRAGRAERAAGAGRGLLDGRDPGRRATRAPSCGATCDSPFMVTAVCVSPGRLA